MAEEAIVEEIQGNISHRGSDLDEAAKAWSNELALDGEEPDEDNQSEDRESEEDFEEVQEEELELAEDAESESGESPLYKVRADGEELDVPLDELISGYSRQASFTKKSQALAEERRGFEDEIAEARQVRSQAIEILEAARNAQSQQPERDAEYWRNLKDEDPMEFMLQRDNLREEQMQNQMRENQLQQLKAQEEADNQANLSKYVDSQREALMELVPEWKDTEVADHEKKLILDYGRRVGFSDEELANSYDSRAVATMRKAALFDQLQEKRKGLRPVSKGSMKGGSASVNPSSSRQAKASARLKKTGSVDDAARVFYNMFRSN